MAPRLIERLLRVQRTRYSLTEEKAAAIPLTRSYYGLGELPAAQWTDTRWDNLVTHGYNINAAVFQCISTLAFGYPEAPPVVMRDADPDPKHALQRLLSRPNPVMEHAELQLYSIIYRAVGGNCYLHKVRNALGQVVELWPYHIGQVWPVPSATDWVKDYAYTAKNGDTRTIPAADIVHLKWPSVDLNDPTKALPPLLAVAREVDTDTEATRYLYALLKNDAMPRTILNIKTSITDGQFERLRQQFSMRHGGDNRGGVGVVEGDATISRMSMNLQELAFEALRRVPESRIAGAFRVPAILAGLYVGLEKATYANYREARSQLTEDTFVPLWRSDATELTQALASEFDSNPDRLVITYDTGKVAALQEGEDAKYTRVIAGWDAGLIMKNEGRTMLGLMPVKDLKRDDPEGDVFKTETQAPPLTIDALVEDVPPMLTDDQKALYPLAVKAKRRSRTRTIHEQMEQEVKAYLDGKYSAAAANA